MQARHALLIILIMMLWGINFVALKIGVENFSPLLITLLRFALTLILLFPWFFKVPKGQWKPLIWLSITMGTIYFPLLFLGLENFPAGETTVIMQIEVPLAALLSAVLLRERISRRLMLSILVSMIGVSITVGYPIQMGQLDTIAIILLAAVFWAITNIQFKTVSQVNPLTINAVIYGLAVPQILVLMAIFDPHGFKGLLTAHWQGWAALFYMTVVSTIFCYSIWFYLMRKYSVSKLVPFSLLSPVASLVTANLLAGEALPFHVLIGSAICLTGLGIIVIKRDESAC